MQRNYDMTVDTGSAEVFSPRPAATAVDTWLSSELAEAEHASDEATAIERTLSEALEESVKAGPVNAAEALALGVFSGARKLVGPDGAELVIDPDQNAYYFESTLLRPLTVLLQQPASAWTPIYSGAVKIMRSINAPQPLPRLRWYAGLVATPGILSRKLNRGDRYKLVRWPETEREFPKHFRIAKEMLKDAATADEVVAASGMPYEEVIDYINASYAGGWLRTGFPAKPPRGASGLSRRQRLFARLNKPLFAR